MKLIVMKFGGTSVGSIKKIKNVANIVEKQLNNKKLIVVLSAMSGVTNKMQKYIDEIESNEIIENDLILTSGEAVSVGLLSAILKKRNIKSIPLLGWQIPIITDSNHQKAKILNIDKARIDKYSIEWDSFKKITNSYEYIHTHLPNLKYSISKLKPLSRAFYKLWEILTVFDIASNKNLTCATLAEGPGGFIEAISNIRQNSNDTYYGITLQSNNNNNDIPNWKKLNLLNKKNIKLEYGIDNTGNILKLENLIYEHHDEKNDSAIIASILHAIDFIKNNKINAIVTNPVNKNSLKHNKRQYNGQTELFADIFNSNQEVMLLTSDEMRVIPLTRHIPISLIPSSINKKLIIDTTIVGIESLKKYFNIAEPKVAITGLNPHAGDNGLIGSEEIEIITPAVEYLQKQSHSVSGPLSADSLFHDTSLRKYDLIVCMYHDQALIPIKARSLYSAVNVTLGLDIIRTSPDHGTGYDIANKFIADESSLIEALILAEKMIKPHVK